MINEKVFNFKTYAHGHITTPTPGTHALAIATLSAFGRSCTKLNIIHIAASHGVWHLVRLGQSQAGAVSIANRETRVRDW